MPILPQITEKVQSEILPLVKPKWQSCFELGINALSLTPFSSLNGNARMVGGANGMMQMYRLVRKNLSSVFTLIMAKLFKITDESFINIDFTMFDPFATLCFALQTQTGRAIPVWVETLKYPIKKDSQNIFILESLKKFIKIVGCNFKIVADRAGLTHPLNNWIN